MPRCRHALRRQRLASPRSAKNTLETEVAGVSAGQPGCETVRAGSRATRVLEAGPHRAKVPRPPWSRGVRSRGQGSIVGRLGPSDPPLDRS